MKNNLNIQQTWHQPTTPMEKGLYVHDADTW